MNPTKKHLMEMINKLPEEITTAMLINISNKNASFWFQQRATDRIKYYKNRTIKRICYKKKDAIEWVSKYYTECTAKEKHVLGLTSTPTDSMESSVIKACHSPDISFWKRVKNAFL
jgi:hypothetical protein